MNNQNVYKVIKVFRNSGRKKILFKNLSIEQAKQIVNSVPDSSKSMVIFSKHF